MKLATFNINNVNRRLDLLIAWLDEARPDVVCLQELKALDRQFPKSALEKAGYGAVWRFLAREGLTFKKEPARRRAA